MGYYDPPDSFEEVQRVLRKGITDEAIRNVADILGESFMVVTRFVVAEEIVRATSPEDAVIWVTAELLAQVTKAMEGERCMS